LETTGQLAQARLGLTLQGLLLLTVAAQGQPNLWQEVRSQGEDAGFALGAKREGR
jgi:hypothetical protein